MEINHFYSQDDLPGLPLIHRNCRDLHQVAELVDPYPLPFFSVGASCGFPSPADDYVERLLDLNELCVSNPPATYTVRADGDSMTGEGIDHDDVVLVDRSLIPQSGDIVIALVEGMFTLKQYRTSKGKHYLVAANDDYPVIVLRDEMEWEFFGVVTFTIKAHSRRRRDG